MQTNFFSLITEMAPDLDVNIRITKAADHTYIVAVHPFNEVITDPAKHNIRPIVLAPSSIEKLNNEFFESIQQPIQQIASLFADMEGDQKAAEIAREKSQMEKKEKDEAEKEKKEKKTKYDAKMKKVEELEKAEKYGEAIGAMPDPKEFSAWEEAINKKLTELRGKSSTLSLFNA